MADPSDDIGSRERILAAVFSALARIPDVELCERNRDDDIDKDVATAVLMFDGDMLGDTDRPYAASRNPVYPMSFIVEIWGAVQGGSGNVGTRINALYRKVVRALHTDPELLAALAREGAGVRVSKTEFPVIRSPGASSAGAFFTWIELPFEFDPTDP